MNNWIKCLAIIIMAGLTACGKGGMDDLPFVHLNFPESSGGTIYYVDSKAGDDNNSGLSVHAPWRSLAKVQAVVLNPGDIVRFKRGSDFAVPLFIKNSGVANNYITLTDYGKEEDPAPKFTNPVFEQDNFGNCIRIQGSYVIVENLYFHHTAAFVDGDYQTDGGWVVWEMGAVYIDKGSENCIVRNNEFFDCVAGIRSYGMHALIANNYIHDCNRALKQWNWGPLGIWLGGDYQTVIKNRIVNMQVADQDPSHFTNGVGGGAIEIDDGRYLKSNITLSHNFSINNCGFLETVFNDVVANPVYQNWKITFNVSDDYQAFVKLRFAKNCTVDNNTIIRRKVNATELGVFVFKGANTKNKVRNNIIVTESGVQVFNIVGNKSPGSVIENNLYYSIGPLVMGKEGPGISPFYGDPLFMNYHGSEPLDYVIKGESPALNKALDLNYPYDFIGMPIPFGKGPDIGAFEYHPGYHSKVFP